MRACVGIIILAAAVATSGFAATPEFDVTDTDIDAAVSRGRDALLSSGPLDALAILALVHAGVAPGDPRIGPAIREMAENAAAVPESYLGDYIAGIELVLFASLNDARYLGAAATLAHKLQRTQNEDGGWGDNSRTQFALLGLKSARDLGLPIDKGVFDRARAFIESRQNREGGWGYGMAAPPGYNSMTAAGVSSLYITLEDARKHCPVCGAPEENFRLNKGVGWLGRRLSIEHSNAHHFYYLYSLERVGVLLGQKYFGGRDWYREGARFLIRTQQSGGGWSGDERATEFALLFLAKGRARIAINKLQYGDDWNSDPCDATELTALSARELATPMCAQVLQAGAPQEEFNAAPILYLQGRNAFEFTPDVRGKIKAFVEQGGFIVASACCGGSGFNASLRAELRAMFPESTLAPLPADHEVFSIRHSIAKPDAFALEGLSVGCRPSVFYAPHDVCCAWSGCAGCLDPRKGSAEDSKNLGVNIVEYVLRFCALKPKLSGASASLKTHHPDRGELALGQLRYTGEWNPDPAALDHLAARLKETTGLHVSPVKQPVAPGDADLGDFPVLYLTGHNNFQLPPSAEGALRSYLDRGGFLFCDACCGRAEFDAAFRRLCANIYPEQVLTRISQNHPIFCEPYKIEKVAYKPVTKQLFPYLGALPYLEGIVDGDGRIVVLYSRFNLGCELQNHPCTNCVGLERDDAFKVSVNAVVYALSH